jgi:hypothetical protein
MLLSRTQARQQRTMGADEQLEQAARSGDVAAARAALDSGADKERKDKVR